jgi:hypothetical protein
VVASGVAIGAMIAAIVARTGAMIGVTGVMTAAIAVADLDCCGDSSMRGPTSEPTARRRCSQRCDDHGSVRL